MRYCSRCGHEINGEDLYCEGCGNHVGMKICAQCGNILNDDTNFCPVCGIKQNEQTLALTVPEKRKYKKHIIPLMVWSLILVAMVNPVGTPVSAVSALYLLSANTDEDKESTSLKIKKSLILCIASTVLDIATLIVLIFVVASKYAR